MDEFKERAKIYSEAYAQLVINRSDGQHIDIHKELMVLRRRYNMKHFNTYTLAQHENRELEVIARERELCWMIVDKYLKKVPYPI